MRRKASVGFVLRPFVNTYFHGNVYGYAVVAVNRPLRREEDVLFVPHDDLKSFLQKKGQMELGTINFSPFVRGGNLHENKFDVFFDPYASREAGEDIPVTEPAVPRYTPRRGVATNLEYLALNHFKGKLVAAGLNPEETRVVHSTLASKNRKQMLHDTGRWFPRRVNGNLLLNEINAIERYWAKKENERERVLQLAGRRP